jgi:hypothetical protein
MRLPAAVLLLVLVATAALAPLVRSRREAEIRPEPFLETGPLQSAREAEADKALGIALATYAAIEEGDPAFPEAIRGRLRTALRTAALAFPDPELASLIGEQIDAYLRFRELADPEGTCLREAAEDWLRLRLSLDAALSPAYFFRQVAAATFLAARGDATGVDSLLEHARSAPFHVHFFPFARTLHPGWNAVRPLVEFYLASEVLEARVEAGTALLAYRNLFDEGADLLLAHGDRIRSDLAAARKRLRNEPAESAFGLHAPAVFAGTALLGGPEELRAIREASDPDYTEHVDLLRIARLWLGIEPLETYALGGRKWELLDAHSQFFFFQAAIHRLAALRRERSMTSDPERREQLDREIAEAGQAGEAGLVSEDGAVVMFCLGGLMAASPEQARTLGREAIAEGGPTAVIAAALTGVEDPAALLLPYLLLPDPDAAAVAAATLLGWADAPAAIARPRG